MDVTLCEHAAAYAKKIAKLGKLTHDSKELRAYGEGENLYGAKGWGGYGIVHSLKKGKAHINFSSISVISFNWMLFQNFII